MSAVLRALFDFGLRLLAALALFRAVRRAARADDARRVAEAREGEVEAALDRPRNRRELVRRLRERGL